MSTFTVTNELGPTRPEQIQHLMSGGPDHPIFMVNLLHFKDTATYEDGRETDLSGRDAYQIYGRGVADLLPVYGGALVFAADVTFLTLGQADQLWDEVAIAAYPNRKAMVAMSSSEAWRELSVHRTAGLQGQLNIETKLADMGNPDWLLKIAEATRLGG